MISNKIINPCSRLCTVRG